MVDKIKRKVQRHGMKYTKLYAIWKGVQGRCFCKSNSAYMGYGAKGITSDWDGDFLRFKKDMGESYELHCKLYGESNTSIDRIDFKKGYSKDNCKWSTKTEQANNKSNNRMITYKGETDTLGNWARKKEVNPSSLRTRLNRGWKEDNLFDPKKTNQFG